MSIDSCYEGVIAQLTKQGKIQDISKKFLSLTTNSERVLYVYDILSELKAFPKILEVKKNDNVSVHYRNLGNKFFQKLMYYQAWQYYNLALLHATIDSEVYSLALSNRSAVFHALQKYKQCLQDIHTVFSMKYSVKIKDKLNTRKVSCEKYLLKEEKHSDDIPIALSVIGSRNSTYPCASSKLKVVSSKEMGRHVIAKDSIKVGEVLAEEDPYFVLLLKSQYLFCCSYCISRNLNLMPCDKCCFALYCNNECKEKAWKQYHSVECGLMPTLFKMDFTKIELLALRVVIKARTDHQNWPSLLQTIKDIEANDDTEYQGCVKVNNEWVYDSKYYATIHTLATNIDKRSVSDIFQKSVTAAVLFYFLKTSTFLNPDNNKLEMNIKKCVAGSLLLHVMTSATNMHGLSTNMENEEGNYVDVVSVACAPYGFLSLLNHSCAPNVVRLSELGSGTMKLIALRPIRKGQQLYDNYGAHHAIQDLRSRQADLKFQYKFNCCCEACIYDWPTYPFLPSANTYPTNKILTYYAIQKLQKGDPCIALKIYKQLCEAMTALEPQAPCSELADCQESMKQCLAIFEGLLPYGYSQLIDCDPVPPKLQ